MKKELAEVVKIYSLGSGDFCAHIANYSKPALIGLLADLLTLYFNDRNSSTLREFLTTAIAGYEHTDAKIGYNGFKTIAAGKTIDCEVKPQNFRTAAVEELRQGKRKSAPQKLHGGGSFNDYTWARLDKDITAAPNILVSGFVDGRLLYILEFSFACEEFVGAIKAQLEKDFSGGDQKRVYLRGAGFDYRNHPPNTRLIYRADDIESFKDYIVGAFYKRLVEIPVQPAK